MQEPSCPKCKTDDYLEFFDFEPARDEPFEIPTAQGSIRRVRHVHPVVMFRCLNCGHRNGHSVRDDWRVPTPNPKVQPEHPAQGEGIVYG